jgi:hypothetical protein
VRKGAWFGNGLVVVVVVVVCAVENEVVFLVLGAGEADARD